MKSTSEELFRLFLVWSMGYLTSIFVREIIISDFLREASHTYKSRVKPRVCVGLNNLRRFLPVLSSFLYVTLLFLPCVTEIITVSNRTSEEVVSTIKNCSIVLSFLSVIGGLLMGYQFHYCCGKKSLTQNETNDIADYVFTSSPMNLSYLYSPGYIVYVVLPWWIINTITWCRMKGVHKVTFPAFVNVLVWIPLLVYFPFFAIGSSYRNVLKDEVKCEMPGEGKDICKPVNESTPEKLNDDTKSEKIIGGQLYSSPPQSIDHVQGESSKVIYQFMTKGFHRSGKYHPTDVDDYERNRALLLCYPEWKLRMQELGTLSKEWKVLVDYWHKIEVLYCKDYDLYKDKAHGHGECDKYIRHLLKSVKINISC